MWAAPWVVFHQDDLSWWAFPFILCACLLYTSSESAFLVYFPCICVSVCFIVFLVHFRYISCAIPICPPAIGQTPKFVEIVSSKALCLSLVFIWAYFIWKLVVRNWGLRTANKLPTLSPLLILEQSLVLKVIMSITSWDIWLTWKLFQHILYICGICGVG